MHFTPNAGRARLAIILIAVVTGLDLMMLVSDYMQLRLLTDFSNGKIDMDAATANDLRQRIIALSYIAAFIVSTVTYVRWFRRAYRNLEHTGIATEFSNSEAAWSWFIPFINLFKPFQVMKSMYRETAGFLREKGREVQVSGAVLGWWWTLWVLNNVMGQIVFRTSMAAETIEELLRATKISMASTLISVPLSLVAILVIQNYAEMEKVLPDAFAPIADPESEPTWASDASGNTPECPPA